MVLRNAMRPVLRSPFYDPLTDPWGGIEHLIAGGVLVGEYAGFGISFEDTTPRAVVKGHTTNFSGDPNDLLTSTSPSTKYVRNASGLLVAGTTMRTHHDADGNALGLMIEGDRKNIILQSENLTTSPWNNTMTATLAATTAPDGTETGILFEDDDTGAYERIRQTGSVANDSNLHEASIFAKDHTDGVVTLYLALESGTTPLSGSVALDLASLTFDAGSVGDIDDYDYEEYANGWVRFWVRMSNNSSGNTTFDYRASVVNMDPGTDVGQAYLWGAQLTVGTSSYIQTESVSAWKFDDELHLDISEIPYNVDEGTFIVTGRIIEPDYLSAVNRIASLEVDANDQVKFWQWSNQPNYARIYLKDGGADQISSFQSNAGVDTLFSQGLSWSGDGATGCFNGAVFNTDGTVTPPDLSAGKFLLQPNAGRFLIKSAVYVPRRMTDTELEAWTTL